MYLNILLCNLKFNDLYNTKLKIQIRTNRLFKMYKLNLNKIQKYKVLRLIKVVI